MRKQRDLFNADDHGDEDVIVIKCEETNSPELKVHDRKLNDDSRIDAILAKFEDSGTAALFDKVSYTHNKRATRTI